MFSDAALEWLDSAFVLTEDGTKYPPLLGTGGNDDNVPFHRDEFCGNITAFFNVDLAQIRGYGLGDAVEKLLYTLALYKIRSLLDNPFRPRTACDLEVENLTVVKLKTGFELPALKEIEAALPSFVKSCTDKFAKPTTTSGR
jgi:CRISPR-associated protein Csb1